MQPVNQRQGFLVSMILHLTIFMVIVSHAPTFKRRDEPDPTQYERKETVFMPSKALLRQLAPKPIPRPAQPVPC